MGKQIEILKSEIRKIPNSKDNSKWKVSYQMAKSKAQIVIKGTRIIISCTPDARFGYIRLISDAHIKIFIMPNK